MAGDGDESQISHCWSEFTDKQGEEVRMIHGNRLELGKYK